MDCIYCRDTDEIVPHQTPVERVPSGRGQSGDVGPYGASESHLSPAYLLGRLVATEDALARLAGRFAALEARERGAVDDGEPYDARADRGP